MYVTPLLFCLCFSERERSWIRILVFRFPVVVEHMSPKIEFSLT